MSETSSGPAILVEGLTKSFGDVHALRGIDLVVPRGHGARRPRAERRGQDDRRAHPHHPAAAGQGPGTGRGPRRRPAGSRGPPLDRAVRAVGRHPGGAHRPGEPRDHRAALPPEQAGRPRAGPPSLLEQFDLVDAADRHAKNYSGGMQRRLDLAASLVGRPQVLFLDEPTTGLDPRSRLGMWDIIRSLVAGGTTLLLTTQYLDEADELADEIVVIDHGLVIAAGTAEELKSRVGGDVLEFTVPDRNRIERRGRGDRADRRERAACGQGDRRCRAWASAVAARTRWSTRCAAWTRPACRPRAWRCGGRPWTTCSWR